MPDDNISARVESVAGLDGRTANPFTSHAFLSALENSGSVGADAGWLPRHLVARDDGGKVAAVAQF